MRRISFINVIPGFVSFSRTERGSTVLVANAVINYSARSTRMKTRLLQYLGLFMACGLITVLKTRYDSQSFDIKGWKSTVFRLQSSPSLNCEHNATPIYVDDYGDDTHDIQGYKAPRRFGAFLNKLTPAIYKPNLDINVCPLTCESKPTINLHRNVIKPVRVKWGVQRDSKSLKIEKKLSVFIVSAAFLLRDEEYCKNKDNKFASEICPAKKGIADDNRVDCDLFSLLFRYQFQQLLQNFPLSSSHKKYFKFYAHTMLYTA
jgi:hypothetical protein